MRNEYQFKKFRNTLTELQLQDNSARHLRFTESYITPTSNQEH